MSIVLPNGQVIPAPSRQNIVQQGIVSPTGVCTITFNPPPQGYTFTGTIAVYDSPSAASWQIALSGTVIDITSGASSVGNIQIQGADVLTLTASNLLPFAGQTFHANFTALCQQDQYVTPIIPSHDSLVLPSTYDSTVLVSNKSLTGNAGGTANIQVAGISIATKYIKLYWLTSSVIDTSIVITGNQTGIIYDVIPFIQSFGPIIAPQGGEVNFYVESALDSSVTITFPQLTAAQTVTLWVTGSPISPLVHVDDGQIVPVNVFPAGGPDTLVVGNATVAGTPVNFIPAPSTGKLQRVGTLTLTNVAVAAVVIITITGTTSGTPITRAVVAAAGAVNSSIPVPCDAQVSEGLSIQGSANGQVNVSTYYRTINSV